MRLPRRHVATGFAALAALAAAPAGAHAATELKITGHGYGHGVGMSQWGAYGYAKHGYGANEILTHYYTGTQVSPLGTSPIVKVLIKSGPSVAFSGASRIGERTLDASKSYSAAVRGSSVVLRSPTGRDLVRFDGPVAISNGGAPVRIQGSSAAGVTDGSYRGAVQLVPQSGKLLIINALGLEDYVRGVVAGESPASWPAEALKAQAVAARTYAITTDAGGSLFTQWSDTRSQVYRGVTGETATTDAAVRATAGRVVTYRSKPITTFFFSTSGGRTENNESSFLGATPQPYLRSVADPYDSASPKHKWSLPAMSMATAKAKLGSWVKGSFRGVRVVKRGASPRIVKAVVAGSRGNTTVSGPQLRARLGLYDTWAQFRVTTTNVRRTTVRARVRSAAAKADVNGPPASGQLITGSISSASPGNEIVVERRSLLHGWPRVAVTTAGPGGRYATLLPGPGTYRVSYRRVAGPAVTAR